MPVAKKDLTNTELQGLKLKAEVRELNAKAAFAEQQTLAQKQDTIMATALAESATIAYKREAKRFNWEQASDSQNRIYQFSDEVNANSVEEAITTLARWDRIDNEAGLPEREYRFVISSGGGSVIHGMKLYSALTALGERRPVVTIGSGIVASMAVILHQSGTTRLIETGTSYLIHDISGDAWGTLGSVQDTLDWMNELNAQLHKLIAKKSNQTPEQIAALSKRKDVWLLPERVIELGLADGMGYSIG